MEKNKVSRKALKSLLNDSLREAIGRLELPEPSKKLDKIINKSSKRLAQEFADLLKKQSKKQRKISDEIVPDKPADKSKKSKLKSLSQ